MKRLSICILVFLILLTAVSCGKEENTETSGGGIAVTDINKMTALEAYNFSKSKKNKINGAKIVISESFTESGKTKETETEILLKAESKTGYFFSMAGNGDGVCFHKQKLYLFGSNGNISTVMSQSQFLDYFAENIGDKWYFADGFSDFEKDGRSLSFSGIKDKKPFSLISGIPENEIVSASGKAEISEDFIISGGSLSVIGEKGEYKSEIKLAEFGSENVRSMAPDMDFVEVSSLKATEILNGAYESTKALKNYSVAINSSDTFSNAGGETGVYYSSEINCIETEVGAKFGISERTLTKGDSLPEQNILKQVFVSDSFYTDRTDDMTSKKKLSETKKKAISVDESKALLQSMLLEFFPKLSDVSKLEYTETADKYSIEFSLNSEKLKEICQKDLNILEKRGMMFDNLTNLSVENCSGAVTVLKQDMSFDSLSISFSVKSGALAISGSYSMLCDRTKEINPEPVSAPDYSENY